MRAFDTLVLNRRDRQLETELRNVRKKQDEQTRELERVRQQGEEEIAKILRELPEPCHAAKIPKRRRKK